MKYDVVPIVCDYGVFEDGNLKLICNSQFNALLIADIMEVDASRPNITTIYNSKYYESFLNTEICNSGGNE